MRFQRRHHRVAHFNGQVTAGHHDAVAGQQNFFQQGNGFCTLDLRQSSQACGCISAAATLANCRAISMSVAFLGKLTAT